jgi:hypothetical protein
LRTNSKLAIIEFTIKDISDILKSLNIKKASGHDLISHHMLKNTANTVSIPLKIIFDYSIQTSTFPDHWKLAKVISLFKNGNKSLVSNYRPISLLSCVGKTFERVVFKQVSNYFLDNKLLCKYQSGFVPGCSTVHQLIEIFHKICISLFSPVFCDISKAFDRV